MRAQRWLGTFILVAAVAACGNTTTTPQPAHTDTTPTMAAPTGTTPTGTAPAGAAGSGLTMDAYNKLTTGMTEAEATAITGPCETNSETGIASATVKVLSCKGQATASSAILIFTNGKLKAKEQFGLDRSSSGPKGAMTLAKFNQLQIGQTSAAVEAITGPCEKSSVETVAGHQIFALTCHSSDGLGRALLLFGSDKLKSKSQVGLK